MRRLLTTLFILLVVVVAGLATMVALINPNDFRNYMVAKVEQRSGYKLALEGDLRWHAWPQMSIIAGRMKLTAPGATVPLVSAENMRLDVALWPLLSHQLSVKQILLKGAVITITPDSEAHRPDNTPIAPAGTPEPAESTGWSWNIGSLKVADSLFIWQRDDNDQLNLRDLNLQVEQNSARLAKIDFSSRINRDQRDLNVSLSGNLDLSHYPSRISASVEKFSYRLQRGGLLEQGIQGEGAVNADYSRTQQTLQLSDLTFSANDSQLSGQASAKLGDSPNYQLDLSAKNLNLETLLGFTPSSDHETQQGQSMAAGKPVIAASREPANGLTALNIFSGQFNLTADRVIYHGFEISSFKIQADNRRGHLTLNTLSGKLDDGEFSVPGTLDATGKQPEFVLQPVLKRVALGPLLQAFSLPKTLTGLLSMDGRLQGHDFTEPDFAHNWHGSANMTLDNARLEGLNFQQLIQRAVTHSNNDVSAEQRTEHYSEVKQLTAHAVLNQGNLQLNDLAGSSELLALTGSGKLDLPGRACDINLNIRVLQGWKGNKQLVEALTSTDIPLRIYGPWAGLNYQLHVDQLLRKRLEVELRRRLNEWSQKNQQTSQSKDVKKLIDKL